MTIAEQALPRYMVPTGADRAKGAHSSYTLGIDLGQSVDNTALVLIEREVYSTGKTELAPGRYEGAMNPLLVLGVRYTVRGAELIPLGTSYTAVAAHVAGRAEQTACLGRVDVVYDETGARGASEMIRAHLPHAIAAILTGGEDDARLGGYRWSVAKGNMVSRLLGAIEAGDLGLAEDLRDYETFKAHMTDLRRKISALGRASFNAAEGRHDDYCTAAGLAWWWATRDLVEWRQTKLIY